MSKLDQSTRKQTEISSRNANIHESGWTKPVLANTRKSAPWKLARKFKSRTGAINSWLAKRLHLGNPPSASQNIKRWKLENSKH